MSNGVEFDGDNTQYTSMRSVSQGGGNAGNQPKMIQWLMKKGIVKSANGAQTVLIAVIIINLVVTFSVIKYLL